MDPRTAKHPNCKDHGLRLKQCPGNLKNSGPAHGYAVAQDQRGRPQHAIKGARVAKGHGGSEET